MSDAHAALAREWTVLQHDHEQYERNALWIRLFAIGIAFISLAVAVDLFLSAALILLSWIQEAVTRTSQARTGSRLLQVESLLRQATPAEGSAFQFHSEWLAGRGSSGALLAEYAAHAARPTIVFFYVVLLLVLFAALIMPSAL